MNKKIKSITELKKIAEGLRKIKKKIVWTNGCFDLIHMGHITALQKAKHLGDFLIVGINSDNSVKRLKGKERPITPQNERAEIIAALECVDYVTIFPDLTPNKVIKTIKPDIHVKGSDYKKDDIPESQVVKSYGGKIMIIKKIGNFSTLNIIQKILKRYSKR